MNVCDFDNYDDFYLKDIKTYYSLEYVKYPKYVIYNIIIELGIINIYFIIKNNGYMIAIMSRYRLNDDIAFDWKGSAGDFMVFKNKYDNNTNLGWKEDINLVIDIVEAQTLKYYGFR